MGLSELLRLVAERLGDLGIPYFITGSVASTYFGDLRFTNDIDIVVDLSMARVDALCAAFVDTDVYVSEESARRAVARNGQFNLIHSPSGFKVDLIVAPKTPFNRSRFLRCRPIPIAPDFSPPFSSPEDVILRKMISFQEGGSEKHLRDIAGILRVSAEKIDRDYVAAWSGELGLLEVWERVTERVEGGQSARPG